MTRGTLFGLGLLLLSCSASRTADSHTADSTSSAARHGANAPDGDALSPAGELGPSAGAPAESPPRSGGAATGRRPQRGQAADGAGSGGTLAARYASRPALETYSGKATYYADSLSGNRTASGERYDPKRHSAAHRKLPFGTVIRIVRKDTGATTYARVNDRGPFGGGGRIVDLSRAAAEELEMLRAGVVSVRVEVVERPAR
jgi:rare lipoprotein A